MQAMISNISGIDDAIVSMLLSRRKWTPELDEHIRKACDESFDHRGFIRSPICGESDKVVQAYLPGLIKRGIQMDHHTLLSMIDITVTIQDIHRGAQDDLDAHAHRMGNRVVRNSTRMGNWQGGEKSDWYRGKILPSTELSDQPETVNWYGVDYKWNGFGYVREDLFDDQDVQRGTYPMSIPSTFLFKVGYDGLRHIYKVRGPGSHAHPEIQEAMMMLKYDLHRKQPWMGLFLNMVWDPWSKVWRNSITGTQVDTPSMLKQEVM